jgi:ABC-2 type transport system permease protein
MRHLPTVAGREFKSFFYSPVAYVVLTLFAVLAGFFFVTSVLGYMAWVDQMRQMQLVQQLRELNLNDQVLAPFFGVMTVILMFLVPAVTMGLFAAEKTNGTDELLFTSPITMWEIVLGKFLAAAAFVLILVAIVAVFPGFLFWFGDPEAPKTLSGLLGLLLVGLSYAAVGAFASSLTRSQIVAWFVGVVFLLILWMLSFLADLGSRGTPFGETSGALDFVRALSTVDHFEQLVKGLVVTSDLAYFAALIGIFLLLAKAAVESVRWR